LGDIDKISPVYQTPAMGFEGDYFLNCVIHVKSTLTPNKTLRTILSIEKKMGRKRLKTKSYTSRSIDIDILFFNTICKKTNKLTIPHPEIQNRKFVLQPLADVNSELVHPELKKNVISLLAEPKDKCTIIRESKWLRNPKNDYDISKYRYIAIEGNIGAGKTSLATKIATDFNAKLILERFKENPFLPKFYENPSRFAFPLEMSFLADRYQQHLEDITQHDLFKDYVVTDYDAYKSIIFAKITLQEEEFALYKKLFHLMHKELPKPDMYIYLYQSTDRLLENIKKRGRKFEQEIEPSYLKKINKGYLEFINTQPNDNIKIIDISDRDFIKSRKDYLSILREIIK